MSTTNNKEEIDLFDLFRVIKNGFNAIGNAFLRLIAFLLRNSLILISLIIVGLILGYFWNKNTVTYNQTDAIVSTDFEGASYLYKRVEELNFKFSKNNESLKKSLNIEELSKLSLEVAPIYLSREISNEEEAYMEYLEETKSIEDKERSEFLKNSVKTHKITLVHPAEMDSKVTFQKIIEFLRDNEYFKELYKDQSSYITSQIENNKKFIKSLDQLIENYSEKNKEGSTSVIVNGANFDFNGLISRRTELQKETAKLIQQRIKNQEFLNVLDEGSPKKLEESKFTNKNKMVLAPLLLIFLFFIGLFAKKVIISAQNLEKE